MVRIGQALDDGSLGVLERRVRRALGPFVRRVRVVDYELPGVDRIDAGLLSQALDEHVGGHILGITDIDLVDGSGVDFFDFVFGCKDQRNHVALASRRRLASRRPARAVARLAKVALHELGHNFGLVHHYSFQRAGDDACCPMTKGTYNRHGERSYVRAVIDARGDRFCDDCLGFLARAHGPRQVRR